MRQQRWFELVKDYDYEMLYYLGNANSVADALGTKEEARLMAIQVFHPKLQEEINELKLKPILGSLANLIV